ncbi:MAG: transposase [Firmicutes bacterium]|nr:transposase [Bacillota bacterium]
MTERKTITKTVFQYSKELSSETINELRKIADDYNKVKNYIFGRYSGINSLAKLTPGYTVLNEMRYCGLRQQLNLPSVYYELAIFDALRDIKSMWGNLKNKIADLVRKNENLTQEDRIYLLTVLKYPSVFNAILCREDYEMPRNSKKLCIDVKRLNSLLCRYVRKYKQMPKVGRKNSFTVSPMGYKYYEKGLIGFVSRIPRKRIMVDLRDKDIHTRQLKIFVEDDYIKISAPIDVKVNFHEDYTNTIFLHIGFTNMFALSNGKKYGENFNKLVNTETNRLRNKNIERYKVYKVYMDALENGGKSKSRKIKLCNLGKQKYSLHKKSKHSEMITFINSEINRMLREQSPCTVVITKAIIHKKSEKRLSKFSKEKLNRSFEGYIRKRLMEKCFSNGIKIVEVSPKDISVICSECGCIGKTKNSIFLCESCGLKIDKAINSALNIEERYLAKD